MGLKVVEVDVFLLLLLLLGRYGLYGLAVVEGVIVDGSLGRGYRGLDCGGYWGGFIVFYIVCIICKIYFIICNIFNI